MEPVFIGPPPTWLLPKVVFFSLLVASGFLGLFGLMAFITPHRLITDPSHPLSDRLGGSLVGSLFSFIAMGLAAAAFAVHRLYLRRNHG